MVTSRWLFQNPGQENYQKGVQSSSAEQHEHTMAVCALGMQLPQTTVLGDVGSAFRNEPVTSPQGGFAITEGACLLKAHRGLSWTTPPPPLTFYLEVAQREGSSSSDGMFLHPNSGCTLFSRLAILKGGGATDRDIHERGQRCDGPSELLLHYAPKEQIGSYRLGGWIFLTLAFGPAMWHLFHALLPSGDI